jgi:hypothetical protein
MLQHSGFFKFRIDPLLGADLRRLLDSLLSQFREAEIAELNDWSAAPSEKRVLVDFVSEGSLHFLKSGDHLKICLLDRNQGLFSFGQNLESSLADVVLDDSIDMRQLERLIKPRLDELLKSREAEINQVGVRNLRKFEIMARAATPMALENESGRTSESLLEYAQALVDLERDLIHADDISRFEKVARHFAKTHIEKAKFQYYSSSSMGKITPSKQLLSLPRYKGQFQAIEMNWEDDDYMRLIRKFFFYHTLVNFFHSQQDILDQFFDEQLWEEALDAIPFPVVLISGKGEVHQHNTLFSKLNYPPVNCLDLKLREKTVINEIPYNIFRKEIHHLDEIKLLFVFFTESFFLKGDGNHTPSGQELGIISSSIAHELNNPIAGIQAALTLLMLDDSLNAEAEQTLKEMKSGSMRCKQLIETFLGFSRANPKAPQMVEMRMSPVEVCYQQAQNLLRFRTVESGIRFSLEYSKHADFRASVNLSLLTMTFYLIMGELMTLYSHQLLVANKNQIEKVIKGEIVESSQEIQIQLHELNISNLTLSKLIQNLLTIENFALQVSDYSLRFIYNP